MKQVLHILRKDARHYWPEWAVSLALMVGFARHEIQSWRTGDVAIAGAWGIMRLEFLLSLTVVLLPIAWMLLVVRTVQAEALVGDRQFWVTRPYEWKKLLAAKILFVLLTVNVPLLILDCYLLERAGFAVFPHLAGLLWMQLLIAIAFFLPIATLATVTATLAQVGLATLLLLLYLIGMAYIGSKIPSSSFGSWTGSVLGAFYLAACVAVILLQYARRRTAVSRAVILGLGVVVVLFVVLTPYGRLVARAYPQLGPGDKPPVRLALLSPPRTQAVGPRLGDEVLIHLPLSVSGIGETSIVAVDGEMLKVTDESGTRWNSGWQSHRESLLPGQERTYADFFLPKRLFEQMTSSPVTVKITLAFTEYENKKGREFMVPAGRFELPGVGLCSAQPPFFTRRMHCLAPLRRPPSGLLSMEASETTCNPMGEETLAPPGAKAYGWIQGDDSHAPAEFGISPVKSFDISPALQNQVSVRPFPVVGICPGTPIRLSNPKPIRRARMELVFRGIRLSDYRLGEMGGATGAASFVRVH